MILKNKNHFIVSILITLFLACTLQGIFATDTTINSDDETGIKGGITSTSTGGTLTLQPGTYNKTNKDTNISIDRSITIKGNGSEGTVKIDAQKKSGIFTIYDRAEVTFINIIFMNGHTTSNGGAIFNKGGGLIVINCTFTNNKAAANNTVAGFGGAIYNSYWLFVYKTIVVNSTFTNNTANDGGAIYNKGSHYIRTLSVYGSTFTNNIAVSGGAIYNYKGRMNVSGSTFTQNSGGAINNYYSNMSVYGSTFTQNSGGAIYNYYGNMSVYDSTFTQNTASYGGAIYNYYSNMNVSGSTFTNNIAVSGGAINNYGNMSVYDSTFTQNTANIYGGAINNFGNMSVYDSTFTQNTARYYGSAIHNDYSVVYTGGGAKHYNYGNLTVINSTFTNNVAKGGGGAIYNQGGNDNVLLVDCEFINNTEKKVTTDSTITTNFKGQNATISGVLTNENNDPIFNAKLTITINGEKYTVTTGVDGSWTITLYRLTTVDNFFKVTVSWEGTDACTGFNKTAVFNRDILFNVAVK